MKTRKIFLEGYVQYVAKHFKGSGKDKAFAVLTKNGRGVLVSQFTLAKAKADTRKPVLNCDIYLNEAESKFALVFDEEGKFSLRSYQKYTSGHYTAYQMSNNEFVAQLKEMGFELGVRYNAEIPEEGVIVIKKEV